MKGDDAMGMFKYCRIAVKEDINALMGISHLFMERDHFSVMNHSFYDGSGPYPI